MLTIAEETPIQLENLDSRLKMILKLKLREFIHLSPFFLDIPNIDLDLYQAVPPVRRFQQAWKNDCPNKVPIGIATRRRPIRHTAV